MENKKFFVYKDNNDGNVAIGSIPIEFEDLLTEIKNEWHQKLTQKQLNASTHHEWYVELSDSLKSKIDTVRNMKLWKSLCNENFETCNGGKIISVPEMDEMYYFNLGSKIQSERLYGANGNVDPHVDSGKLFQIKGLKMYRVLVGLSDSNLNTATRFINAGLEKKINKNDYVAFDFDRTLHQVVKQNKLNMPRYLLKLHFVICENCNEPEWKIKFFKQCHVIYESVTRYVMDNGTDPETWYQFMLGMILEIEPIIYIIACLIALYFIIKVHNIKDPLQILKYLLFIILFVYFVLVTLFWTYYVLTGYR
jgi:hypothetical protein